jgi:hypothetical protein
VISDFPDGFRETGFLAGSSMPAAAVGHVLLIATRTLGNMNPNNRTAHYSQITSRLDEVVTPYTSAFLADDGDRVTNVTVQDACPLDAFEHHHFPHDPVAQQWVLHALGRDGPASPSFRPVC